MFGEWNSLYLNELKQLKKTTLDNSEFIRDFTPRFIVKREFVTSHLEILEKSLKDRFNPLLNFSAYQEFKIITLLDCLNKAKSKYKPYSLEDKIDSMKIDPVYNNTQSNNTSQLILVNNIIKNSPELTTCIFLLEWLQKTYSNENFNREKVKNRFFFQHINNFHPDRLNSDDLPSSKKEEVENYNKLIEVMTLLVRQGKLHEAQKMAEYYDQSYLSAMLNGGLPMNDYILNGPESLAKVDWELFPPYMKNKDFKEISNKNWADQKNMIDSNVEMDYGQVHDVASFADGVVGNPDWPLWLSSIYGGCKPSYDTLGNSGKTYISNPTRLLRTFISGNVDFISQEESFNVHDLLYVNLLSFLNSKILNDYEKETNSENSEFLNYCYTQDDHKLLPLNPQNNVDEILNSLKANNKFKAANKIDFLINFEFDLIKLHFIENKNNFYTSLSEMLNNLLNLVTSNEENTLNDYLNNQYKQEFKKRVNKEYVSDFSKGQQYNLDTETTNILRVNYLKLICNALVVFYSNNQDKFYIDHNDEEDLNKFKSDIFGVYDALISIYFTSLTQLILRNPEVKLKPEYLVYILGFCLHIEKVQENLINLANQLNDFTQDNFESLRSEIETYFFEYREELLTNIANGTNIYKFDGSVVTIDDILEHNMKIPYQISPDDKNKIDQITFLFKAEKLDQITMLKFMLKLALKFLSTNKFNESALLENNFMNQTKIEIILGKDFLNKNVDVNINDGNLIPKLISFFENNLNELMTVLMKGNWNIEIHMMGIVYCIMLVKLVNNCYFDFKDLVTYIGSVQSNHIYEEQLKTKKNKVLANFKMFIHLVRILIISEQLRELIIDLFQNDVYLKEVQKIISDWTFQVLKWTTDMFTLNTFKGVMVEDSITLILDLVNFKEELILKHFLVSRKENFLEEERSFFRFLNDNHEVRKSVYGCIHKLSKTNKNLLLELLDDSTEQQMANDLNNFQYHLLV